MPNSERPTPTPAALARLPGERLLEAVQRQTFRYFWDGADPATGLAPDRRTLRAPEGDVPVTMAGSGFGIMAMIVAVERGWVTLGTTKTGMVYRLKGNAPQSHE